MLPLAYPEQILDLAHNYQFYNAPGKKIVCDVYNLKFGSFDIRFSGDLNLENNYYRDYQNQSGLIQETRLYYSTAGKIHNLESFPKIADSINNLSLTFLNNYNKPLPRYFKAHETARLNYNAAFRKYNVLFDREFRTGTKNTVSQSYFDFEKSLPLIPDSMYFNTSYLTYIKSVVFFRSTQSQVLSRLVATLDELMKPSEVRDAIKMNMMSFQPTLFMTVLCLGYPFIIFKINTY